MQTFGKRIQLRTKVALLTWLVVSLSLLGSDIFVSRWLDSQARENLSAKAQLLCTIAAQSSEVISGLSGEQPVSRIQGYAEKLRSDAAVEYVVVMDLQHRRLSHPNVSLLGQSFVGGDENAAFQGKSYVSIARGTLGLSMRAFAPVFSASGRQIGAVAVGILMTDVEKSAKAASRRLWLGLIIGISLGFAGGALLAAHIKKILLGMQPEEISRIFEERNALLHAVREGIVAVDRDLRVTVVNEEARRILRLGQIDGELVGESAEGFLPMEMLRLVMENREAVLDQELSFGGITVLTNLIPLMVQGQVVGEVITFRDKSELRALAEQLTDIRIYTDALRVQTHDFMNKLHAIGGLIHLERYDRLKEYISSLNQRFNEDIGYIMRRIHDPAIAGFLMAKLSEARERGIQLSLGERSELGDLSGTGQVHELITILGNLFENAMDAVKSRETKEISLTIRQAQGKIILEVSDSGAGIPKDMEDRIFEKGYSTKGQRRGYGLFHTAECVARLGGQLSVESKAGTGALFRASLPLAMKDEG